MRKRFLLQCRDCGARIESNGEPPPCQCGAGLWAIVEWRNEGDSRFDLFASPEHAPFLPSLEPKP